MLGIALVGVFLSGCVATGESTTTGATSTTSPVTTTELASATTVPTTTTTAVEPDDGVPWIVYQGLNGLLRVIRPDGTGDRRALPDGPERAFHPDWSRDGQRLAFNVDSADGTRDIWIASWDGSGTTMLVDCRVPCRDADSPAWSPDGTRIAFNRIDNIDGHNPGSKIQTVDIASGEITTIFATEGAEFAGGQRWSPDGRSLVVELTRFIDDGNETEEITGATIGVIDLTATPATLRLLAPFDSLWNYPDWHPTLDLILFAAGGEDALDPKQPPQNLFTIRPDGSGLTQLTHQNPNGDGLWMPAFRLDGDGILVTIVHRPQGDLTLGELQLVGSGIVELGDTGPIPGAHSRQRPVPSTP